MSQMGSYRSHDFNDQYDQFDPSDQFDFNNQYNQLNGLFYVCLVLINSKSNTVPGLLIIGGIGLFIILYAWASNLYPGGNDIDKNATGFSWMHNYWCELMASYARNGEINPAREVAIPALFVLAASLIIFWWWASILLNKGYWIIRYGGLLSMLSLLFLFIGSHDMVMNTAGLLGMTAMCGVLVGLYRHRAFLLWGLGIFCLFLCLLNNYIYHSSHFYYYLAIIQKISFFFFLLWFCLVTMYINRRVLNRPG